MLSNYDIMEELFKFAVGSHTVEINSEEYQFSWGEATPGWDTATEDGIGRYLLITEPNYTGTQRTYRYPISMLVGERTLIRAEKSKEQQIAELEKQLADLKGS